MEQSSNLTAVALSKSKHFTVMVGATIMIACVTLVGAGLGLTMSYTLALFNATDLFGVIGVCGVLSMALGSPIGASLSGSLGIRKSSIIFTVAFIGASLFTAFAVSTNIAVFIISRLVLGFASGLITGGVMPIASYIYSPAESGKGFGLFTAAIAFGGVVGGVVAGFLVDHNMLFLSIAYPSLFCMLGGILVFAGFPNIRGTKQKTDFIGLMLLMFVLVFLLFPLNYYKTFGWGHPLVLGSILLFVLTLFVMYKYENKRENPLILFRLFKNTGFLAACLIGFAGTGIFTALQSNYLPILSQSVIGTASSLSGLVPMPKTILTIILPPFIAAWLAKKQGRHWIVFTIQGLFVLVPSVLLCVFAKPSTSIIFVITMVSLVGIAESCKGAALSNFAQSEIVLGDVPKGLSLLGLLSTASTAIASAVFGMLLSGWNPTAILPDSITNILSEAQLATLSQSGTYMATNTTVSDIRGVLPSELVTEYDSSIYAIRESLGSAVGRMFLVCVFCGVVVILISVFFIRKNNRATERTK